MANLIIFGAQEIAEVAHFYFNHDSGHQVKAFTVDGNYLKESKFLGLPVIAFDEVSKYFPPDNFNMFVAMGYGKVNENRKKIFFEAKQLGYKLVSYICSKALYWGTNTIGDNCFILEGVVIQPFVTVGNNVFVWSASHIGHHAIIKDHCFLASHVVVGGGTEIGEQCFLGINSTVRNHIKIGDRCVIGAATTIMSDCKPDGLYIAQPTERATVSPAFIKI